MALMESKKKKEELEKLIDRAIKKIQGTKENDLCKYLPGSGGGYMHHFTLRKMKSVDPDQLFNLIQNFIITSETPQILTPKQRAPRGSRKGSDFVNFTRLDIEKVLDLARKVGDKDLVARFSPKRSLPSLKRELIRSIRESRINQDLWNAYMEVMTSKNSD